MLQAPVWDPEVRQALEDTIRREGRGGADHDPDQPPIAALDWDDTCIAGDISETALAVLDQEEGGGLVEAYEEGCRRDLRTAYVELVHTLVSGRTPDEVTALAERALSHGRGTGRIVFRESMRELVAALLDHGWTVTVITASPEGLVQPLAVRYGLPPRSVLGMRSVLGPEGRNEARLAAPPTHFEGKLVALRARHGRDPTLAAGDSWSDAPMMSAARYALLLDRGDAGLLAEARARAWWIHRGEGVR